MFRDKEASLNCKYILFSKVNWSLFPTGQRTSKYLYFVRYLLVVKCVVMITTNGKKWGIIPLPIVSNFTKYLSFISHIELIFSMKHFCLCLYSRIDQSLSISSPFARKISSMNQVFCNEFPLKLLLFSFNTLSNVVIVCRNYRYESTQNKTQSQLHCCELL